MSNIQTLQEKVQKAEETVAKRQATITRHEKALAKKREALVNKGYDLSDLGALKKKLAGTDEAWSVYEVESKERDIVGATKKLRDAERILGNWQEKLDVEVEKERFLSDEAPQVIKDFLEEWKQLAYDWHIKRYNDYQAFKAKLEKERAEAYETLGIQRNFFARREQEKALQELKLDYRSIENRKANFAGGVVLKMDEMRKESERLEWLDKTLEKEKKAKMLDLINRINAIVGTITDAKGLAIRGGNLNGIIIGEKASAKVETISAGGWNIQCWHYRTLVNKIK